MKYVGVGARGEGGEFALLLPLCSFLDKWSAKQAACVCCVLHVPFAAKFCYSEKHWLQ